MKAKAATYPSRGLHYSVALHALLLIILLYGLPGFLRHVHDTEEAAIPVIIVPYTPETHIPYTHAAPPDKSTRPTHNTASTPPVPPATHTAPLQPQAIPTIVKHATPPMDFNDVLHNVSSTTPHTVQDVTKLTQTSPVLTATPPNDSTPLSMSETDLIRSQVRQFWNAPVGARDAQHLLVTLHIKLGADGTVETVELARDQSLYAGNTFFRAAADAAIRAVHQASPLKGLPADKFGSWGEMEMTFNPEDM